ncbi:cathepsin L-like [Dermacentor silvarum]|uniref:cathepsin L-like n=1 Tax=Dermacentor silvarum TaxID=543639 RepID=UPI00210164B6|nr:cathepsin L-like [Dermacentor silvarum]
MQRLYLISYLVAAATAANYQDDYRTQWEAFKSIHSKTYQSSEEDLLRFKIFTENSRLIANHNAKYVKGLVSFKLGMNQFGDLLPHEISKMLNGLRVRHRNEQNSTFVPPANVNDSSLPESIDWREKGAVTAVKDQGKCGSCWAFSATGALEGQHFLKTGKLVPLSEQNLIDCAGAYGPQGCEGGNFDCAFTYVKDNGGIDTEESYPYEAVDGACRFKREDVGATDTGFVDLKMFSESELQKAVANVGPISVGIDASRSSFHFYAGGVYDDPACFSTLPSHAVLVVGYGVLDGKKYWLVKNSWSESWGDKGYILMSRDKDNQCGIATVPSYPLKSEMKPSMPTLLLVTNLVAGTVLLDQALIEEQWKSFKSMHGKLYQTKEEEQKRLLIFSSNLELIKEHNQKYNEGNVSFKLAMNRFGDMVGALESQQFLKTGKLIQLSAQNIVDCGAMFHNRNCDGGFMDSTYGYIKVNGGIDSEESYPYVGTKSDCAFDPTGVAATVSSFVDINSATEMALKTKVALVGPVCAFIDNRMPTFTFYSEGVYHDSGCSKDTMYQGVLIVGYGATEKGEKYWIVRNSWGTNWGQEGYILIRRDAHNECGIASFITYPVI